MYIASLEDKLKILISHAHDDHCDDHLLQLFHRDTAIISSDFASQSVKRRLKKLGFDNYIPVDKDGIKINSFSITSIRNDEISQDDALYLIRTPEALVIHSNDNWFKMESYQIELIKSEIDKVGRERTIFMSQTNSASGYPLNYVNYSGEEKKQLLRDKVKGMISTGLQNAVSVGAAYFHSYAGYASVFVKGKQDYLDNSLFPTPRMIKKELSDIIPAEIEILDLYPGDTFDFSSVKKSFFQGSYTDEQIRAYSTKYYLAYGQEKQCDSYKDISQILDDEQIEKELSLFLQAFNEFVIQKVKTDNFHNSVIGKKLAISIPEIGVSVGLQFGKGLITEGEFNKEILVSPSVISQMLKGEILFENLYTGYNAEFKRNPKHIYNRDIIMYMGMFSYIYQNRIAPKLNAVK